MASKKNKPHEAVKEPETVETTAEEKTEEQASDVVTMTQEELEQVIAEMPAPVASESEETDVPQVEIPAAAAAAAEQLKSEAPPEDDDRPIHQRLFSSPEEPCVMPMPPEETTAEEEPKTENTAGPSDGKEAEGKATEGGAE